MRWLPGALFLAHRKRGAVKPRAGSLAPFVGRTGCDRIVTNEVLCVVLSNGDARTAGVLFGRKQGT